MISFSAAQYADRHAFVYSNEWASDCDTWFAVLFNSDIELFDCEKAL